MDFTNFLCKLKKVHSLCLNVLPMCMVLPYKMESVHRILEGKQLMYFLVLVILINVVRLHLITSWTWTCVPIS